MSGLAYSVLIPRHFEVADSSHVTALLQQLFDDVQETRKGRHWELSHNRRAASISVVPTADRLHEFEDDLIAADALPVDYPEAFVVCFGCSESEDRLLCRILCKTLVYEFDGKASNW